MGEKWDQKDIPLEYMAKSEHLDMLGVRLLENYTKTRQENGDAIVQQVKNTIERWKSGKFMPLCDRTKSVNSYIFYKIWYKTAIIEKGMWIK